MEDQEPLPKVGCLLKFLLGLALFFRPYLMFHPGPELRHHEKSREGSGPETVGAWSRRARLTVSSRQPGAKTQ